MIKKYSIRLTQQAQDDLEQIYYYIADDSINNAANFVLQLEEKIYSLEAFPDRNFGCYRSLAESEN